MFSNGELTPKKIIHFSLMVIGCQAASAHSRLKKAVSHLDELWVNLALSDQAATFSTCGCENTTIMSLLWSLQAINRSSS